MWKNDSRKNELVARHGPVGNQIENVISVCDHSSANVTFHLETEVFASLCWVFFLPSDVKNSTFLSLEVENSPNQTWCWCYQMGTSEWSSLLELLESVYKRWWKYGLNISAPLGLVGVWNYMGKAKIDSISLSPSQHNRVSGGAPIDKHFFFK